IGGAIGGASNSLFAIGMFGAAQQFDDSYVPHGKDRPVHRGGGLASMLGGTGISWGRNASVNSRYGPDADAVRMHESYHYLQQKELGFANFYGITATEYFRGFIRSGSFYDNVYRNP